MFTAGNHEISAAGGLYHQEVIGVNDRRDVANVFTAWTRRATGGVVEAWHAIAGYRLTPDPRASSSSSRATTSYSTNVCGGRVDGVPAVHDRDYSRRPARSPASTCAPSSAQGAFYGYVSYGLSEVTYDAKGPNLQLWYGEETLRFNPPHDRRHQVSTLVSATVCGVRSSRPGFVRVRPAVHARARVRPLRPDRRPGQRVRRGRPAARDLRAPVRRPAPDLPPSRPVDRPDVRARPTDVDLTVQASVINAYDRRNLFYYDTFTLRRVDQLPLVPSFGLKFAFND